MGSLRKIIQLIAVFLSAVLGPAFFVLDINDLADQVICNIAI